MGSEPVANAMAVAAARRSGHSAALRHQVLLDSNATRLPVPAEGADDDVLVDFLERSTELLFGADDPNLDGQKRLLSITAYRSFTDAAIWAFVQTSLERWKNARASSAWYIDWQGILDRRDAGELASTLLGHDETALRRRGAISCASMLDPMVVLKIKRGARR